MSGRAAGVGAAVTAVGLAAAGYGIAWAASGPSAKAQPAGSDLAALAANNQSGPSTATVPGPGGRPHRMFRGAGGKLTAVGPDTITVTGPAGASHTINTNSSTTYSRDGAAAQRSDLAVGERVLVRLVGPGTSSGTQTANPTAANVDVIDPAVAGTVQSIQGGVITVADRQGFWRTVDTSGTTKFMDGTTASTLSALKVGDRVIAFGTIASDHTTLDAIEVRIVHPGTATPGFGRPGPGMMRGGWFRMRGGDGPAGGPATGTPTFYGGGGGSAA